MKKYNTIYAIASAINIFLIIGELVSFAIYSSMAVNSGNIQQIYYFLAPVIIFLGVAITVMCLNKNIFQKDMFAQSTTLHLTVFIVNAVNLTLTNTFFIAVLNIAQINVEKCVSLLFIGVFYLMDVIFFLMHKGYATGVNNVYDDAGNKEELDKKVGLIVGIALMISNTIMLLLALFTYSIILNFAILAVNLITVLIAMALTVKKYKKKRYL